MADKRTQNPHIDGEENFSPLKDLMAIGLTIFGDFAMDNTDGSLAHLLLFLANGIVDEVNAHPYWTGDLVEYYEHPTDRRRIPDQIMASGIAGYYATHQTSAKAPTLMASYYRTMNRNLWLVLNGNTPIRIRTFDKGNTDPLNGIDRRNDGREILLRQSNPQQLIEEETGGE